MSFFGCAVDDEDHFHTAEDEVSHGICLEPQVPSIGEVVGTGSSDPATRLTTQPPSTEARPDAVPGSDVGERRAQIEVADSDSESGDVWAKARQRAPKKPKAKARALDVIFGQRFDRAVANVASVLLSSATAAAAAVASSTPGPKPNGGAPAPESVETPSENNAAPSKDPKPGGRDAEVTAPASRGTKRDQPEGSNEHRATRGTAGTFAGRRPPKDTEKLRIFNAKKAAWEKAKEEAKLVKGKGGSVPKHSSSQLAFIAHMTKTMKENGGGKDGFSKAAKSWRMKRPAAAHESVDEEAAASSMPADNELAAASSGVPQSAA